MKIHTEKHKKGWKVEIRECGRSLSRLWIINRWMRIGQAALWTGGIGGVGTDRSHRNKGLARKVIQASLKLMQQERYDVSFLFGIADFYDKFGFATCMAEQALSLDVRAVEKVPSLLRLRSPKDADWPQIIRLYNRDNARRTGSIVRYYKNWEPFVMGAGWGIEAVVRVMENNMGKVCGYLVYDDTKDRCRAAEVAGQGAEVYSTALHCLARRAIALRRENIYLSMPPDHGFAQFCRAYGSKLESTLPRNAGPMGRIVNLAGFMDKLLPEIRRRGEGKTLGAIGLTTDIGTWQWRAQQKGQPGLKVTIDQAALMQLAMGYETVDNLSLNGRLKASQPSKKILAHLFPGEQAHMWWADRF